MSSMAMYLNRSVSSELLRSTGLDLLGPEGCLVLRKQYFCEIARALLLLVTCRARVSLEQLEPLGLCNICP